MTIRREPMRCSALTVRENGDPIEYEGTYPLRRTRGSFLLKFSRVPFSERTSGVADGMRIQFATAGTGRR